MYAMVNFALNVLFSLACNEAFFFQVHGKMFRVDDELLEQPLLNQL